MTTTTTRWQPNRTAAADLWPHPPMLTALSRGLAGKCPACGKTKMFGRYLKVVPACENCSAPLGLARADDAPPYFTILIAGHIIVPLLFMVDRMGASNLLLSLIFIPLTIVLTLAMLQPIKGATVGLMLNLNMLKSDPNDT